MKSYNPSLTDIFRRPARFLSALALVLTCLYMGNLQIASAAGAATDETVQKEAPKRPSQYVVRLLGTREGWPDNMTPDEIKVMQDHYIYLKNLVAKKKVVLAGPCPEGRYGLIIIQTYSKEEAMELMDNEPSVKGGVHAYEMEPFHLSLLMDHQSRERYVRNPSDKMIRKEQVVNATLDEVWEAWTTTKGVTTFFAPEARVALVPGGPFEIHFVPSAPAGQRGSEGCKILSWLTKDTLCFDWNAPLSFGDLRTIYTRVTLRFEALDHGKVKVTLFHEGWGKGENWEKVYNYFDSAWSYVLSNMKKRFDNGPIDWSEGE